MPKARRKSAEQQPVDAPEETLRVSAPKAWAAGVPGVYHALREAVGDAGVGRSAASLLKLNQRDGFDCPSCAWPDPPDRKTAEFCENGAKAVGWEADKARCATRVSSPSTPSPSSAPAASTGSDSRAGSPTHCSRPPVTTTTARSAGDERSRSPAKRCGRWNLPTAPSSTPAAGRATRPRSSTNCSPAFGTNNLPDCSNMCHESTSAALTPTIGIGKGASTTTTSQGRLIVILGQNPGTNHPRMLTALEEANGAAPESSPSTRCPRPVRFASRIRNAGTGSRARARVLADAFYQVRLGGDLALLQAAGRRVLAADDERPGSVLDHRVSGRTTPTGLADLRAHLAVLDEADVAAATGLSCSPRWTTSRSGT